MLARRIAIVALSFGFVALMCGADLVRPLGHPLYHNGIVWNSHAIAAKVEPPALLAGVRPGDTLDLERAAPGARFGYGPVPEDGTPERIPLVREGHSFEALVTPIPENGATLSMVWVRALVAFIVGLLGALVVLRRPSPASWAFFFLTLNGLAPINVIMDVGPAWFRHAATVLYFFYLSVPPFAAIFFALYLGTGASISGWRRRLVFVTWALAIVTALLCVRAGNAVWSGTAPAPGVAMALSFLAVVPLLGAPMALFAAFYERRGMGTARLRWIIAGFLASLACSVVVELGTNGGLAVLNGPFFSSYVTHSLLLCLRMLLIAVPVTYAILKDHIIDVNVALSRATVYGGLSIAIVAVFALVDLFTSRLLSGRSAGLIADIVLALILAFSFDRLQRAVERLVDTMLFRERQLAEEHLNGLVKAMSYAKAPEEVCAMLLDEPVRVLRIAQATLCKELDRSVSLRTFASYLEAQRVPVRIEAGQWDAGELFALPWKPGIAVPVFAHSVLDSIALYSVHRNGTQLETEEIAVLERLATAAGNAFDRLESALLRRELQDARTRLETLTGAILRR